ncbi:hydroxypyruvate reductase [Rhodothermaceae bacterium RA]|nr:hydroxypyruvate reductase [Rhodothermaceae bacterium RA]
MTSDGHGGDVRPEDERRLAADAEAVFEAGVRGVQADALLGRLDLERLAFRPLEAYRRIRVVGIGKAALAMGCVLEPHLEHLPVEGVLVVPHGYPETLPSRFVRPKRLAVHTAGHPMPDASSVEAAETVLRLAEACGADDLLIALISGGGTALCTAFVEPIRLEEARETFDLLLRAGAEIHEMNTVRRHLSQVGGGRLARAAAPAEVQALVVSDVVGDDLSVIASGPTVPDPSTCVDARRVLVRYGLWTRVPASVRAVLEDGERHPERDTPKPGDPAFRRVRTELLGNNRRALAAAAREAERRGYAVAVVADDVTGEAREVAPRQIAEALARAGPGPACLLWGGETTVTVRGRGRGGRNQEWALAAALALDGVSQPVVALSGGTDGRDGPTDAAGAWVSPQTVRRARARQMNPEAFLEDNDAYTFFQRLQQLLQPGPTHTNVMDLQVVLLGTAGPIRA